VQCGKIDRRMAEKGHQHQAQAVSKWLHIGTARRTPAGIRIAERNVPGIHFPSAPEAP